MGGNTVRVRSGGSGNYKFYPEEALRHLSSVFRPCEKCWLEIRIVDRQRAFSQWFRDPAAAVKWLAGSWGRLRLWERHVFYGVLPRVSEGEPRGAGNSSMVREGHLLFADIDYKEPVNECKDGDSLEAQPDGSLKGCVVIDGKAYRVERPSLNALLEKYKQLFGDEPYLVVDSGYGYHVFARLPEPVPVDEWRRLQDRFIELLGGDPKSRDPARVLRLAGTVNPKNPAAPLRVRIVYSSDSVIDPGKLDAAGGEEVKAIGAAAVLASYWVPGHRDALTMALTGMMIKAGVPLEKARRLIEEVVRLAGDEEASKRLYEVERQYKLVAEGRKKPSELCGKKCLVDELEQILSETRGLGGDEARDKAIEIIQELEKVIGPARSILVKAPYSSNSWLVNDPKRGIVLLRVTGGDKPRERRDYISDWYIARTLVVKSENEILYRILLRNARTRERLVVSGDLQEIARVLKRIHGVKRRVNLEDALSAIVSELIKRGVARVKRSAPVAGILPLPAGDSVRLVRRGALSKLLIPSDPDVSKARRALELLARMRGFYDPVKFDAALLWAGYAPASYVLKKAFHVKQFYLLLHGERQTGKTTLARIITSLYPVVTSEDEEVPEEGQSEYRLAWKLNVAAVPLLEDEVQGISRKPSLLGLLKRASSGDTVRWRGDSGRRYHARAPLIFTSNYTELLSDPAVTERVISLEFGHEDYVYNKPVEALDEFKKLYDEYRAVAPHLGAVVLETIVESWDGLREWGYRIHEARDALALGKHVWELVASRLSVEAPPWATGEPRLPDQDSVLDEFTLLETMIREAVSKAIDKSGEASPSLETLRLHQHLLPGWLVPRRNGVCVLPVFVTELAKKTGYTPLGGLKAMAQRIGYQYVSTHIAGRSVKCMLIPVKDFIRMIEAGD